MAAPAPAERSASISSSPLWNRSSGAFASAFATTSARPGGTVGAELGHGRRRLIDVGHDHGDVLVLAERRPAGEALEQDAAERVDVGASVDLPALSLLRGRVADRADELARGRQPGDRARVLGEPEVGEVDVVERLRRSPVDEQDVGRLDVAVDEPEPVRRVERARDLAADRDGAIELQRPGRAQQPSEVRVLDMAHGDVEHAVGLARVVDRDHVRVVDARRHPRLA